MTVEHTHVPRSKVQKRFTDITHPELASPPQTFTLQHHDEETGTTKTIEITPGDVLTTTTKNSPQHYLILDTQYDTIVRFNIDTRRYSAYTLQMLQEDLANNHIKHHPDILAPTDES